LIAIELMQAIDGNFYEISVHGGAIGGILRNRRHGRKE